MRRDINTNRKKKTDAVVPKLRRDELIVKRLSATVSGKAQKFYRIENSRENLRRILTTI